MEWVAANLAELEARYAGEWIAVMGDTVVAHGIHAAEVAAAARAAGHIDPYYEFIPEPGDGDYSAPILVVSA
jgi:hypothetical protein